MRFADLDAVTLDAFGTLLELLDPVPALRRALAERGIERDAAAVGRAFGAEAEHYVTRTSLGHDAASLALLREDCAGVFLAAVGSDLDPAGFVDPYLQALVFRPLPGTIGALRSLRARGLGIAVVSNWDISLGGVLETLGLGALVDSVVTSAEAGADKPDPAIFHRALARIGADPARALHIGDRDVDEQGARAAGMRFAPAAVAGALAGIAA